MDRRSKIKTLLSRRRFLYVLADLVDDLSGSIDIDHNAAERLLDLNQMRRLHVQKILGRARVVACAADRLRDFV